METGFFVLLIAIITLAPIIYIITLRGAKDIIQYDIQSRGAKDIVIQHEWFDFDRDTMTFYVEFTNSTGKRCTTHCKLHHWGLFFDNEVYWSGNVDLEPRQLEELSKKLLSQSDDGLPTKEISSILLVPNSEDTIVMLKYVSAFRNVFRCKPDGSYIWQAELPTDTGDVYTNIEWIGNKLTAYSRSCMTVILDVETGKIIVPKSGM